MAGREGKRIATPAQSEGSGSPESADVSLGRPLDSRIGQMVWSQKIANSFRTGLAQQARTPGW